MRAPSGGPIDKTPPHPIENGISPENGTVNMTNRTISIEFDEYIKLNNASQQVLISPPVSKPLEFKIKKRTLIVSLPDSIDDNTTYTINFGNAIQDITEGNHTELTYVFSTGSFLDSLTLQGRIIRAIDLEPASNMRVMLYREDDDSLPLREKPFYFTSTGKSGIYRFEHLREGRFKLFALDDKNSNYLFDEDESIAFSDSLINVSASDSTAPLMTSFTELPSRQFLSKKRYVEPGQILLQFKHRPRQFEFDISPKNIVRNRESIGDSIVFWIDTSLVEDSIHLTVRAEDMESVDLTFFLGRPEGGLARKARPSLVKKQLTPEDTLFLEFWSPIEVIDKKRFFSVDDDSTIYPLEVHYSPWERKAGVLGFRGDGKKTIVIDKGAVTPVFGEKNDSLSIPFSILEEDEYGTFSLEIVGMGSLDSPGILEIMNESGKMISRVINPGKKVEFKYMLPGKYKARMILDKNRNGRWDPGHYLKGKQPEKVIYFNESVSIRGGWDIETEWQVTSD